MRRRNKIANLSQHVTAARHLLRADQELHEAMRSLGILDPHPPEHGSVTAVETDGFLRVSRALDKLRLITLANSIHRDHVDLDGFMDGCAVYQDPEQERAVNRKKDTKR